MKGREGVSRVLGRARQGFAGFWKAIPAFSNHVWMRQESQPDITATAGSLDSQQADYSDAGATYGGKTQKQRYG